MGQVVVVLALLSCCVVSVGAWKGNPAVCSPVPYSPGTTGGNSNGAACVFPFIYNNNTYNTCIRDDHDRLWCATTSNYDNNTMWGNCPATTDPKGGPGGTCVFPFKYKGALFNKCIMLDHDQPWCGTAADVDAEPDQWGECPDATNHPLPSLPKTFTAKIQWNDYETDQTTFMEEFYDESRNKGVIEATGWLAPGVVSKFISDFNNKQFFTIDNMGEAGVGIQNCIVEPIGEGAIFEFPYKSINGTDKMMGATSVLEFGERYPLIYIGPEELDGTQVDKWEACVYIPEMDDLTLHVTYYFTRNGTWQNASPLPQVPVKQVLKGAGPNNKTSSIYDQVYNWGYFGPELPSHHPSIFETPSGQFCDGRVASKALPPMPDAFSFRMEMVDQDSDFSYVAVTSEWYDFKQQITRMDYTPIIGRGENKYGFDARITIHDFSDGISYIIDKERRNCSIIPIPLEGFDDVATSSNITRMRNPSEFFSLDLTPYYYEGQRSVRDILTDVYITERPYPNMDSDILATWEWYFVSKDWLIFNGNGRTPTNSVPVKLIVRSYGNMPTQVMNFVQFTEESAGIETYDVSTCYRDGERKTYNIVLNGQFKGNVARSLTIFRYMFAVTIETVTDVRQIRVQDIVVNFDNQKHVFVQFSLLGPVLISGDVSKVKPQVPLADAEKAIMEWVQAGNFSVLMTMTWEDSDIVLLTAMPNSFKEFKATVPQQPSASPATSAPQTSGFSGGSMAGIGIGMTVLGLVLGAIGVIAYQRIKSRSYNKYKRELSMDNIDEGTQ